MLARAIPQMSNASTGLAEDLLEEADQETDQGKLAELNWLFHRPYTYRLIRLTS
jgi:hypothetical protein